MLTRSACLVALFVASSAAAQDAVPGWHGSLPRAQQLAREQNKPLLIVFRCVR